MQYTRFHKSGCKGTTFFAYMQDFLQKNNRVAQGANVA